MIENADANGEVGKRGLDYPTYRRENTESDRWPQGDIIVLVLHFLKREKKIIIIIKKTYEKSCLVFPTFPSSSDPVIKGFCNEW